MASRRDDGVTTAFIERFHSRDEHLWKKRKELNSLRICLEHQHGRRFIVLEHQYGCRDVMWKRSITSRVVWSLVWNVIRHFAPPPTGGKARETLLPTAECSEDQDNISDYAIVVWGLAVNQASHLSLAVFSVKKISVFTLLFTWTSGLRNNY